MRLIFAILFLSGNYAFSDIIVAASSSKGDVETAIAAASAGDTVSIPTGSSTWSSVVTLPDDINLKGNGVANTVITTTAGQDGLSIGDNCQVSDIKFAQGTGSTTADSVILTGDSQNFLIYDVTLDPVEGRGIECGDSNSIIHPTGVIFNSTLTAKSYASPGDGTFQLVAVFGGGNNYAPYQNELTGSQAEAPGIGGGGMVYIEDCTLSQDAQGDSTVETYRGGKVVVRYNNATNFMLGGSWQGFRQPFWTLDRSLQEHHI